MYFKVLFGLFLTALFSTSSYCAECPNQLQFTPINTPEHPRLDQSIGQTQIVLSAKDGTTRLSKTYEGKWFCLGFNEATKTWLVGGIYQIGTWLPLASIQYLNESTATLKPSAFDRLGYLANAAVISPKGRYIVFIGGQQNTGKLLVLDTQTDAVKNLGIAPAPPPLDNNAFFSEEPFEWGTDWADSYVRLDANILYFKSENILRVSYGKDTPSQRTKKREIRTFRLR